MPRLLQRCPKGEPFGDLARLFLLGVPVEEGDAIRSLGASVDDATALGLLVNPAGGKLVGSVRVVPLDNLLIWAEAHWNLPPQKSIVMAISPSTRTMAQFAIPATGGTTLDLGTGCGALAFSTAARASRVIATDANPRAANFAAFSALFNRLENVEVRTGSFFEPVVNDRFERIISNPPFILTPPSEDGSDSPVLYKSAGLPADGVSELVVRGMAKHLRPGGFGQTLINWACMKGEKWLDRISGWVRDSDCDAWLLRFEMCDSAKYAEVWVPEATGRDFEESKREYDRWLAYYERERIEGMGYGMITLRKRVSGNGWFAEDASPDPIGPCGESVARGFALRDFLIARSDEEILRTQFRLAPGVHWTQDLEPAEGGWSTGVSRLRLTRGLPFSVDVDRIGMAVVSGCRDRVLGAALVGIATEMKRDSGQLIAATLPLIKCLVEQGILLPEGLF